MDFHRIAMLLHVVEQSRGLPKLKAIHDAAMAELEAHADGTFDRDPNVGAQNEPKIESQRRL